jgi:predicted 3-demethylubiquinone-9 3-methyltransferase (glyoxalase superfamily)
MAATRQTAEDEIRGLLEAWANATRAKDVGAIVAGCAAELLAFDCRGPLRFKGADAFRKVLDLRPWRAGRSKGDSSMQKISPFLWFDNQAEEAMNFYVSIFKNSKIGSVMRYGDAGPGPKGSVMTASFELEGQQFTALNGGPHFKFTEAISFVVSCETQEEVNELWDKLSGGGQTQQCGWLKDKFGLSWQIIPSALIELMSDPDPEKSQRVMEAMLQMTKIEIAKLRQAYEGSA